jgi:hypothetical protein
MHWNTHLSPTFLRAFKCRASYCWQEQTIHQKNEKGMCKIWNGMTKMLQLGEYLTFSLSAWQIQKIRSFLESQIGIESVNVTLNSHTSRANVQNTFLYLGVTKMYPSKPCQGRFSLAKKTWKERASLALNQYMTTSGLQEFKIKTQLSIWVHTQLSFLREWLQESGCMTLN